MNDEIASADTQLVLAEEAEKLRATMAPDAAQLAPIISLYGKYREHGLAFPLDLEEHSLRLIVEHVRVDDAEALDRLVAVLELQGKPVDENLTHRARDARRVQRGIGDPDRLAALADDLRGRLAFANEELGTILELYDAHVESGVAFPLDLEEHSLKLILEFQRPHDQAVIGRLVAVLQAQGKPVPPELAERATPVPTPNVEQNETGDFDRGALLDRLQQYRSMPDQELIPALEQAIDDGQIADSEVATLANELAAKRCFLPDTIRERALVYHLAADLQRKDLAEQLSSIYVSRGIEIPFDIERKALEYQISRDPSREDLKIRYCFTCTMNGLMVGEGQLRAAIKMLGSEAELYNFLFPLIGAVESGKINSELLDLPTRIGVEEHTDSPLTVYARGRYLFDHVSSEEALAFLSPYEPLALQNDFLMQLYVSVLHYEGRPTNDDGTLQRRSREIVKKFFVEYTGDLWRDPEFLLKQKNAIDREIPPILIVTLPKSGSLFIQTTLQKGLQVPCTYLCPLGFYYDFLLPSRVKDFSLGGALCVDHLEATDVNMDMLHAAGIRKIVFHYRDIRQSALSYVHHHVSDEISMEPREVLLERRRAVHNDKHVFEYHYRRLFSEALQFLDDWSRRINEDNRFEFLITNFDDLADQESLFGQILQFSEIPRSKFRWSIMLEDRKERAVHFRKGLADEWKMVLSQDTINWAGQQLELRPVLDRLHVLRSK